MVFTTPVIKISFLLIALGLAMGLIATLASWKKITTKTKIMLGTALLIQILGVVVILFAWYFSF